MDAVDISKADVNHHILSNITFEASILFRHFQGVFPLEQKFSVLEDGTGNIK